MCNLAKSTPSWSSQLHAKLWENELCKKLWENELCNKLWENELATVQAQLLYGSLGYVDKDFKVHHNAAALEGKAQAILRKQPELKVANCTVPMGATPPAVL